VLEPPKLGVAAVAGQQLVVRAGLHQLPVFQDEDRVRILNCAQAVGNNDRSEPTAPRKEAVERVLNDRLRLAVEVGRGLVEQEHLRVLEDGPRDGHPLLLPAGQPHAPLPDLGSVAAGEALDEGVGIGQFAGAPHRIVVGLGVRVADVFRHGARKERGVLRHQGDAPTQRLEVEGAHVLPVNRHAPLLRVPEARDEIACRALSGPGRPDECRRVAGLHPKRQVLQRPLLGVRVGEGHVL